MTHLEQFHYTVWESVPKQRDGFLLFDYRKRNPLTHEAAVTVILQSEFMTDMAERETAG